MSWIEGVTEFVRESNRIEGITRDPTIDEVLQTQDFLDLEFISIPDVQQLVQVYQPGAELREKVGMNVTVGRYRPPPGSPEIKEALAQLLGDCNARRLTAYAAHLAYEQLHPFMDGNGRSGRTLWLWLMKEAPLGFLHTWYYQSLDDWRRE